MLKQETAFKVLETAISLGADFADVFIEQKDNLSLQYYSSKVQSINSGITFGIGVRVVFGKNSLYSYTNSTDEAALVKLVKELCTLKASETSKTIDNIFTGPEAVRAIKSFEDSGISLEQKIQTLHGLDQKMRSGHSKLQQARISFLQQKQAVEIFNSEGLHVYDERPYIRFMANAVMKDGEKQSSAFHGPGARGGWSFVEQLNMDEVAELVVKRAETVLHADECPAGKMSAVIDGGFGGVIFHEACGHLLETTAVEKKSSVFWDKKGEMIAHPAVNAVDDGTLDNEWGSLTFDDEGMPTQKTQLIKDGVLTNFLCDYMGELKTGHPRTGSARRESYKFHPASRMRNTFIEPGEHKLEELIGSMKNGIYAKSMGGGSVNPGTGEFNFSVEEAYLVENGKIVKPVKGATLIGTGPDILKNISKVADNFSLSAGVCGSVSGSVYASVGQPAVMVDKILVGGRG